MVPNLLAPLQTLKEETADNYQNIKELNAKLGQVDAEIKVHISVVDNKPITRFISARNPSSCRNEQNQ